VFEDVTSHCIMRLQIEQIALFVCKTATIELKFITEVIMKTQSMACRLGCGACCIAPSISSPIPGMPNGKKAGERCIQLDERNLCKLFGDESRPKVCSDFSATLDVCGTTNEHALTLITELEQLT